MLVRSKSFQKLTGILFVTIGLRYLTLLWQDIKQIRVENSGMRWDHLSLQRISHDVVVAHRYVFARPTK